MNQDRFEEESSEPSEPYEDELVGEFIIGEKSQEDIVAIVIEKNDPEFKEKLLERITKDIREYVNEKTEEPEELLPEKIRNGGELDRKDSIERLQLLHETVKRALL